MLTKKAVTGLFILVFLPSVFAFAGGSGTKSDPYEINNITHLNDMRDNFSAHYELISDIDASDTKNWNSGKGWDAIGGYNNRFQGSLDGNNYTIFDLYVNRTSAENDGIFGYLGGEGFVRELGLVSVNITGGGGNVATIAGTNAGEINLSYATGTLSGTRRVGGLVGENSGGIIRSTYASIRATNAGDYETGGLVGSNHDGGEIYSSYAAGRIVGEGPVGGLVGETNKGNISSSFAYVTVSGPGIPKKGGFIGNNWGSTSLSSNYWSKEISGQNTAIGGSSKEVSKLNGSEIRMKKNLNNILDFSGVWEFVNGTNDNLPVLQRFNYSKSAPVLSKNKITLHSLGKKFNTGQGIGITDGMSGATSWNWSWGDGTFQYFKSWEGEYLTHEYEKPGNYTVNLTVTNAQGGDSIEFKLNVNEYFKGGFGTDKRPYEVTDCQHLQNIKKSLDSIYAVLDDINCSNTSDWNSGKGFYPIGSSSGNGFIGGIRGKGHEVSSLYINRSRDDLGLFATLDGYIRDLGLVNVTVVGGNYYVGAFAGYNSDGNLNSVYSTGTVKGSNDVGGLVGRNTGGQSLIINSFSKADVTGDSSVGGLVGFNYDSVYRSYAAGDVKAANSDAGGLVGYNSGNITSSFALGRVEGGSDVGGVTGSNGGTIVSSFSTGYVTGSSNVGGFTGASSGSINTSYWDINSSGTSTSPGNATGLYTNQMQGSNASTDMQGLDFSDAWGITESYPQIYWMKNGSGTMSDPYKVSNCYRLQAVRNRRGAYYKLTDNISCWKTENWNNGKGFRPIGFSSNRFSGNFNGAGHEIRGLYIDRAADYLALFGLIDKAEIKNVGLVNLTVVNGGKYIAGLVGYNEGGNISDSYSKGEVSGSTKVGGLVGWNTDKGNISNSYSDVYVQGSGDVGGLVGFNWGNIFSSRAIGNVTADTGYNIGGLVGNSQGTISMSYSVGNISSSADDVGGLAGELGGKVISSYSLGDVRGSDRVGGLVGYKNGGKINRSFSAGNVTGNSNVGGLIGSYYASVNTSRSYWDINSSGQDTSAGNATGLNTTDMQGPQARLNMSNFDFADMWCTRSNNYPGLENSQRCRGVEMVPNSEAPAGALWIESGDLHWAEGSVEAWINESEVVDKNSLAPIGSFWMEGSYIHWVGANKTERRYKGEIYEEDPGGPTGSIWIEDGFFHYIGQNGNEILAGGS